MTDTFKKIYMIERLDGRWSARCRPPSGAYSDTYVLEGVDGDEEANTVTYWYKRRDVEE